jgi:hypothetical protein
VICLRSNLLEQDPKDPLNHTNLLRFLMEGSIATVPFGDAHFAAAAVDAWLGYATARGDMRRYSTLGIACPMPQLGLLENPCSVLAMTLPKLTCPPLEGDRVVQWYLQAGVLRVRLAIGSREDIRRNALGSSGRGLNSW